MMPRFGGAGGASDARGRMKRREFIALLSAGAAAWPGAAGEQSHVRRMGVLSGLTEDDPHDRARLDAFLAGLGTLGWVDSRNGQIDYRFGASDVRDIRRHADELIALTPEVS